MNKIERLFWKLEYLGWILKVFFSSGQLRSREWERIYLLRDRLGIKVDE